MKIIYQQISHLLSIIISTKELRSIFVCINTWISSILIYNLEIMIFVCHAPLIRVEVTLGIFRVSFAAFVAYVVIGLVYSLTSDIP